MVVVPDSKVSPPELINHVARLVSSTEHTITFQTLLRDDDIDRLTLCHTRLYISAHLK